MATPLRTVPIGSKTPDELEQYNENWHMRVGYDADDFLRNLCVQSRLLDLCRRKFDYESNVYIRGDSYKPLDIDGDPDHRDLYGQAQAVVSDHRLPQGHDLTGRILKTFASCAENHCTEILSEARRTVSEVNENLLDVPILWMVKYLALNVSSVSGVGDHAHRLAEPQSLFEADVMGLFRDAVCAGGITQITPSLEFGVSNTLAKVLGLRDIR